MLRYGYNIVDTKAYMTVCRVVQGVGRGVAIALAGLPIHFFYLASDSFFQFVFRFIFLVCQSGRMIVVSIAECTEEQKNRSTYDMSILRIQMGTKGRESEGVS